MKPLCDICGDRHESYQAHRFDLVEAFKPPVATVVANASVANSVVANPKRKQPGKYKDPEARKKYMRELMRKRRAK